MGKGGPSLRHGDRGCWRSWEVWQDLKERPWRIPEACGTRERGAYPLTPRNDITGEMDSLQGGKKQGLADG